MACALQQQNPLDCYKNIVIAASKGIDAILYINITTYCIYFAYQKYIAMLKG